MSDSKNKVGREKKHQIKEPKLTYLNFSDDDDDADSIPGIRRCCGVTQFGNTVVRCGIYFDTSQNSETFFCKIHKNDQKSYKDYEGGGNRENIEASSGYIRTVISAYNESVNDHSDMYGPILALIKKLPIALVQTTIAQLRRHKQADLTAIMNQLKDVLRDHEEVLAKQNEVKDE